MKGKKTGGRKAGVPNKTTQQMREFFRDFVNNNFETFMSAWKEIDNPKDKATIFVNACKFVIPALQTVTLESEYKRDKSIEEQISEMAKEAEK